MHDEIMLLILKRLREMEEKIARVNQAMADTADMVVTLAQMMNEMQESFQPEEEDPEIEALLESVSDDPERN